jgi:hypothetical protein
VRYHLLFSALLLGLSLPSLAAKKVDLDYHVTFIPQSDQAEVRLTLDQGSAVRSIDFDLGSRGYFTAFKADGQWTTQSGRGASQQRGIWKPSSGKASLIYRVQLSKRQSGAATEKPRFDSRITPDWALFRGEDLVPRAHLNQQDGVRLQSRLEFELPPGWKNIETAWPRIGKNRFRIDNASRLFDRPTGWMLAGNLISRRTRLGDTEVTVSAVRGQGTRRMDALTLMTFVWPKLAAVFARSPGKVLVVGAGDSMSRGVLAGHDSVYLSSAYPLVAESGTSPLVRELVKVLGGIHDRDRSDWISEGIAEYYAAELVRRAGGMSEERYQDWQSWLTRVSRKVTSLRGERIDAPTTARAVLLLQSLDDEIRKQTDDQKSLDDVVQGLMRMGAVSTDDFIQLAARVSGEPSKVLASALLQ